MLQCNATKKKNKSKIILIIFFLIIILYNLLLYNNTLLSSKIQKILLKFGDICRIQLKVLFAASWHLHAISFSHNYKNNNKFKKNKIYVKYFL